MGCDLSTRILITQNLGSNVFEDVLKNFHFLSSTKYIFLERDVPSPHMCEGDSSAFLFVCVNIYVYCLICASAMPVAVFWIVLLCLHFFTVDKRSPLPSCCFWSYVSSPDMITFLQLNHDCSCSITSLLPLGYLLPLGVFGDVLMFSVEVVHAMTAS